MSSTITHVESLTSPITFITSDSFAFSLFLSTIANRSVSSCLAIALALTTPPVSGDTIVRLLIFFFQISDTKIGEAYILSTGISKKPCS